MASIRVRKGWEIHVFGHKDTQTTAGPATVQAPSMLDNVSSDDFADGASPAVTEVEKQVKEALAAHQQQHLEQTLAAPSSSPAPAVEPTAASAVPAAATPDPDPAPDSATATQPDPDNGGLLVETEPVEKTELVEAEEAVVPHALASAHDDALQNDLVHTVPGIQVQENPAATPPPPTQVPAEVVSSEPDVSPSAPVQPPAQPVEEPAPAEETPSLPQTIETKAPEEPPAPEPEAAVASRTGVTIDPPAPDAVSPDPAQPETEEASVAEAPDPMPEAAPEVPEVPEEPATELSTPAAPEGPAVKAQSVPAVDPTKLADLKQHALDHLEPLADKLDQTPEEAFRTTMMRIQANDNHTLLDKALAAAKSIPDDNARAKALLDIVNEINYFSVGAHQTDSTDPAE